jgi:hypothetical protein
MTTTHNIHSYIHRNSIETVRFFRNVSLCMREGSILLGRYIPNDLGSKEIYG